MKSFCSLNHCHPSKFERTYCEWLLTLKERGLIKDFKYQKLLPIGAGKTWQIDFEITENDETTSYHEAKGFNLPDGNSDFKCLMSRKNFPERVLFWNKRRVPAIDAYGLSRLKEFMRQDARRKYLLKQYQKGKQQ